VADYFETVAKATGEYKLASNWVQQDVLRTMNERKIGLEQFPLTADALADLLLRVHRRELSTHQGREVLAKMIDTSQPADQVIAAGGYGLLTDRDTLAQTIEQILSTNPQAVDDLKKGKKKPEAVKGWLRGQVMKATGGKADPVLVGAVLEEKLAAFIP
jgi:aspartyl-tRNA(Asn)/glutamyl-tRNA(Gln) amidotransferase subunit B